MSTFRALLLALLLGSVPAPVLAQTPGPAEDRFSLDLGTRTWITTGRATSSIGSRNISPISELNWRGVDSVVQELNAEFRWRRFLLLAAAGAGRIDEGVLVDDDFAGDDRTGRFSHTRSDVDERNLFFAEVDVGGRVFEWGRAGSRGGSIDLLAGFQYWQERYVAFGATGSFTAPPTVRAITNEYRWNSVRVGVRADTRLTDRFGVWARGYAIPWSYFTNDDTHHLRTDLKQDPSFIDESFEGVGVQADGAIRYTIWKTLSVEAGYRYWRLDSGEGDTFARTTTGTVRARLIGDTTERYGPFLGLRYRF